MNVLIYTFEFLPFRGGIATYCHELSLGLRSLGHKVAVVAPTPAKGTLTEIPYEVIWIPRARSRTALMVSGIRALRGAIRNIRPDVILATDQYALMSVAFLGAGLRVSCVPIIHGSEVLRHSYSGTLIRRLVAWRMYRFYRTSHTVICVSEYTRTLFLQRFQVRKESVLVVYNGIRDEFRPGLDSGLRIRSQWKISNETLVLLTLARLVPRKGQDTVIRALPRIAESCPNVVYLCVGDGPYRDTLSKLAVEMGVQDRVVFTGNVTEEDKYAYYAACNLFVMVSRQHGETVEGFGLSFLEAWHASRAVLGGRHGGVVEVVDDGVDGALVDPGDVDGVAEVIVQLLQDPKRLEEMGLRGKEKAIARFSDTTMARLIVDGLTGVKSHTQ